MPRRDTYEIDPASYQGDLREDMEIIRDLIADNVFLNFRGKRFELSFSAAATNYPVKHYQAKTVQDVIFTKVTGGATASVNWTLTDKTYVYITVSGACTVRFIAGTFEEVS